MRHARRQLARSCIERYQFPIAAARRRPSMTHSLRRRARRQWITMPFAAMAGIVALAGAPVVFAKATLDFDIRTLSTRADTVTGGDVLIEVAVPRNVPRQKAIVFANGANITSTLHWDESSRTLTGLVTGLHLGDNEISADSNGNGNGRPAATLAITNYPITGPVFSAPNETPSKRETTAFAFTDDTRPLDGP